MKALVQELLTVEIMMALNDAIDARINHLDGLVNPRIYNKQVVDNAYRERILLLAAKPAINAVYLEAHKKDF